MILSPAVSFWKFVITNTSHTKVQVNWLPVATIFASSEKLSHFYLRSVFRWQCGVWEMHDDIFARRWDFPLCCCHGSYRAKFAEKVHKPPLGIDVLNFELNGFNASIWVPWSPPDPQKLWCTNRSIQINKICVEKSCMFAPTLP